MSLLPIRRSRSSVDTTDPFIRLRNDINHLFDSFGNFPMGFRDPFGYETLSTPATDISEDDKHYYVHIDVPGVDSKDLDLTVQDHILVLRGEKTEERNVNRTWKERLYGKFYREIPLPADADADHMRASLKNGVLTIIIDKSASKSARSIPIENS